jgi:hypothetical protein
MPKATGPTTAIAGTIETGSATASVSRADAQRLKVLSGV